MPIVQVVFCVGILDFSSSNPATISVIWPLLTKSVAVPKRMNLDISDVPPVSPNPKRRNNSPLSKNMYLTNLAFIPAPKGSPFAEEWMTGVIKPAFLSNSNASFIFRFYSFPKRCCIRICLRFAGRRCAMFGGAPGSRFFPHIWRNRLHKPI